MLNENNLGENNMSNSLKLVCKSFYDKSFVKDYINNGKGEGILPLGVVSLITSLIVSISMLVFIKTNINQENIDILISQIKKTVPTIAINDGKLIWEDNVINEFYFADNNIKLTVDTKNEEIGINQIRDSQFYLTRTFLYVNNNNEIKNLELKNLSDLSESKYIDLTSDENFKIIADISIKVVNIIIIMIFIILFLGSWIVNCFLCKLTRFLAKLAFKELKELKYDVLERAITISIIPAILVVDSITPFTVFPGWIIRWIAIIAFGIFVAKKHLSTPTIES